MTTATPSTSGISRKQKKQLKLQRELEEREEPIIPGATFNRIIDETLQNYGNNRPIEATARAALHEAGESFLHDVFKGAGKFAEHAGRDTLLCRDVQAYQQLRT